MATMLDPKPKLALLAALFLLPALVAAQASNPSPAPAPGEPKMVILVRHAEKAKEGGDDPNLSVAGAARAQALAKALEGLKVTAIVTTQLKRTGQTAAPLAAALGLTPEVVEVKRGEPVPEHAAKVAAAIRKHAGGVVLVVGHSNTVTPIVAALGGPTLPDLPDAEYSNLFLLVPNPSGGPAQLTQSKYGAPDGDAAAAPSALGGDLHADAEQLLLQEGSRQADLWGANYYPGNGPEECIEYTSLINIRPSQGNRGMLITDPSLQSRVREIYFALIGQGEPLP